MTDTSSSFGSRHRYPAPLLDFPPSYGRVHKKSYATNDPDHWRCRHALGGGPGGSGRRGGPRPKSEGQEGTKKAKGRYNGHRGECGPRLPDEGRAAGGPRSANADLYPPCAVNAEFRSAPGVALLLFAALFVA